MEININRLDELKDKLYNIENNNKDYYSSNEEYLLAKQEIETEIYELEYIKHLEDEYNKLNDNTILKTFSYDGAVYSFNKYLGEESITTKAYTKQKAISNIKYQIKKKRGYPIYYKIEIDEKSIKIELN